jgi:hypothetical protein
MESRIVFDHRRQLYFKTVGGSHYRCIGNLCTNTVPINTLSYEVREVTRDGKPTRQWEAYRILGQMAKGFPPELKVEKVSNKKLLLLLNV